MILVTHDLGEVRQIADSLVVLDRGQVLQAGETGALLADPGAILRELADPWTEAAQLPPLPRTERH